MSKNKSNDIKNIEPQVEDQSDADNPEIMRTMQLEDLNLETASSIQGEELLDQVENLIQEDDDLDHSAANPLEHVDAISRRIEELTQSLQQPLNTCDCHDTADRMIAIDARLAKLQNDVNKQTGRSDKLETGLELINAFGNKIESLTDVVKLSAMEDEVQEDYHEDFQQLTSQILDLKRSLEDQPDNAEEFANQTRLIEGLDERLGKLAKQVQDPAPFKDLGKKIDSIANAVESIEPLSGIDKKLESFAQSLTFQDQFAALEERIASLGEDDKSSAQLEEIAQQIDGLTKQVKDLDQLEALEQKLESLASSFQNLEQLDQLNQKIDLMVTSIDPSTQLAEFETQLSTIQQTLSANEPVLELKQQVEKLHDFVKLGALEAEQFDASRINAMAEQITAIGQMLVEQKGSGSSGSGGVPSEQMESLSAKVDALVDWVQSRPAEDAENKGSEELTELMEKFEALQQFVSDKLSAEPAEDQSGEQLQILAGKLDAMNVTLENQSQTPSTFEGEIPDYSDQIQTLAEKIEQTQETVTTLVSTLVPLVESIQNGARVVGNENGEPATDWESQKASILEGYGVEADGEGGESAAEQAAVVTMLDENGQPTSPELESLRSELEEKLRRAEIDISIERAKIHQERRDLEEMQNDLERRQQKIKSHGPQNTSGSEEDGEDGESSGRWSRFMGN